MPSSSLMLPHPQIHSPQGLDFLFAGFSWPKRVSFPHTPIFPKRPFGAGGISRKAVGSMVLSGGRGTPFSERKRFPFPQPPHPLRKEQRGAGFFIRSAKDTRIPANISAKLTLCATLTSIGKQPLRPAICSPLIPCPKALAGGLGGPRARAPPGPFAYFSVTKSRTTTNHATSH